jgi:hypothetical protein
MGLRFGLGPVFVYEWRLAARRWQLYASRTLFIALVGAALFIVWWTKVSVLQPSISSLAIAGEYFYYALVGTQLTLVLLAAPAYTAGAVCQDRIRGPLLHLLATDLSDAEIILGKLAARLVPVLGLVFGAVPILFAAILLGGIDPDAALGATLVTLGTAVLGCTLALTLSVWGRKTHEVLLATYLVIAVLVVPGLTWYLLARFGAVGWPPGWVESSNAFVLTFLPYLRPGTWALPAQVTFFGGTLAVSAVLAALAVRTVRTVTLGQTESAAPRRRRSPRPWLPWPSLDGNPVLWREFFYRRTSHWARVAWGIYGVLATLATVLAVGTAPRTAFPVAAAFINGFQVCIGLLLLSAGSVTTPLSGWTIVWGKWLAACRFIPILALWPTIVTLGVAREAAGPAAGLVAALVVSYGLAVTSLGLALATWVPRLGRAVALSVAACVLVTAGWFIFVLATMNASYGRGPAAASPFYGVIFPLIWPTEALVWTFAWMLVYTVGAAVLLLATLATFEWCMGRVPQSAYRPPGRGPSSGSLRPSTIRQ